MSNAYQARSRRLRAISDEMISLACKGASGDLFGLALHQLEGVDLRRGDYRAIAKDRAGYAADALQLALCKSVAGFVRYVSRHEMKWIGVDYTFSI